MKIEKKDTVKEFVPITLIIETQKEFDYLYGLASGSYTTEKEDCGDFDEYIDDKLSELLEKYSGC